MMIAKLLDELRVQYRASDPAKPTQNLLDALFRVGEEIIGIDRDGGWFELSPRAQIGFLIRNMLEQWGQKDAGKHLIEAFKKATSPAFAADIYVDRGRELRIFRSDSSEQPIVSQEDFDKLGHILVGMIQAAVEDGTLGGAPFYFDIIRAWAHVANAEAPKAWLTAGMFESANFMAKVGKGLVSYRLGTAERRYTMRDVPEPEFYDLQVLVEAGKKHLENKELTTDQLNLLTEGVRGSEQLLKGRSSEATKDDSDE